MNVPKSCIHCYNITAFFPPGFQKTRLLAPFPCYHLILLPTKFPSSPNYSYFLGQDSPSQECILIVKGKESIRKASLLFHHCFHSLSFKSVGLKWVLMSDSSHFEATPWLRVACTPPVGIRSV